jgi:exodeoxyribonuclease V beta subunit
MMDVVSQPLAEANACLADVSPAHKLVEMEFYLPMAEIRAADANQLLKGRKLVFDSMHGHLKGFIDLIFRHDGKYYVADYKSNYLGDQVHHYLPGELHSAMQHHNYDLQYWIYCIAVDKLLSERIPGYDYEQHFGGVYYFFLRGMDGSEEGQGVFFTRPEQNELQAWKDWLSGNTTQPAKRIDVKTAVSASVDAQMGLWDE